MPGWRDIHVGFEGDAIKIAGVPVWQTKWLSSGEADVELGHPAYPEQMHPFTIYILAGTQPPIRFAAAELSNGVWGFYVAA